MTAKGGLYEKSRALPPFPAALPVPHRLRRKQIHLRRGGGRPANRGKRHGPGAPARQRRPRGPLSGCGRPHLRRPGRLRQQRLRSRPPHRRRAQCLGQGPRRHPHHGGGQYAEALPRPRPVDLCGSLPDGGRLYPLRRHASGYLGEQLERRPLPAEKRHRTAAGGQPLRSGKCFRGQPGGLRCPQPRRPGRRHEVLCKPGQAL